MSLAPCPHVSQVLTFGATWDNRSDVNFLNRAVDGEGGGGETAGAAAGPSESKENVPIANTKDRGALSRRKFANKRRFSEPPPSSLAVPSGGAARCTASGTSRDLFAADSNVPTHRSKRRSSAGFHVNALGWSDDFASGEGASESSKHSASSEMRPMAGVRGHRRGYSLSAAFGGGGGAAAEGLDVGDRGLASTGSISGVKDSSLRGGASSSSSGPPLSVPSDRAQAHKQRPLTELQKRNDGFMPLHEQHQQMPRGGQDANSFALMSPLLAKQDFSTGQGLRGKPAAVFLADGMAGMAGGADPNARACLDPTEQELMFLEGLGGKDIGVSFKSCGCTIGADRLESVLG